MVKPRNGFFRIWREMSQVAWVSLLAGVCILIAAVIGAIINPFVGNWIRSGGMAIVGLFYLVLFISNFPPRGISAIGAADVLPAHGLDADVAEYRSTASVSTEEEVGSR